MAVHLLFCARYAAPAAAAVLLAEQTPHIRLMNTQLLFTCVDATLVRRSCAVLPGLTSGERPGVVAGPVELSCTDADVLKQ